MPAARELVAGRTHRDNISTADATLGGQPVDIFSFKGRAGQTVTIDAAWQEFDGKLVLVNSRSRREENDDFQDENHSRISYTFAVNETVLILASGLGADDKGDYTLSITDNGTETISELKGDTRTLVANGLFKGELGFPAEDSSRAADVYVFNGKAGEMVVVELLSMSFDAQLEVKGPDSFEMSNDDGEGMQKNSRLMFKCPADGEYRISASSYEEYGSGQYLLRFNRMKFAQLMQMSGTLSGGNSARHVLQLRRGEYYCSKHRR